MENKIKVTQITITRAEGRHEECGHPVTCLNSETSQRTAWQNANEILVNWSYTAPKDGGYDKCDFVVAYENGEQYKGRFDLMHIDREYPNLAAHIRSLNNWYAGRATHPHCGMEKYKQVLKMYEQEGYTKESAEFLDNYEIG